MKNNSLLIFSGIIILILFSIFVLIQENSKAILPYIIIFAVVSIITIALYYFFQSQRSEMGKSYLIIIFGFAILFRITLLFSSPSTSDDVYRYIWEGKLVLNGYNPFEYTPDSDELKPFHTEDYPDKVTYPHMTTIYPPVAQLVFAAGYLISGESDFGLKLIFLLAEIITMLFILNLLRIYKIADYALILYAWLALPLMEYFINSHIDVIGIMFFTMSLYFMQRNKPFYFALSYSFAILSKLFPLFFIFVVVKKFGWKNSLRYGALSLLTIILFTIPFVPQEREISASLFTYLSQWSFNGSVYKVLLEIIDTVAVSRLISLLLFAGSVFYISVKFSDSLKAVYLIWIAYIIFTPTLYPWYLGWIAALNPLFAFSSINSLLITINVSNFTPLSAEWTEFWWAALIQYIPFYGWLIWDLFKTKRTEYETN